MATKVATKAKKQQSAAKFDLLFHEWNAAGEVTKKVGLTFERIGKTSTYKPTFVVRDTKSGLDMTLSLPSGSYEKLNAFFSALDAESIDKCLKNLSFMLRFV